MAPRKGVGNKKGKQPAQRRQVTQASPSHSSSDEESWPVWQRLQNKIEALEAQTLGKQSAQPRGVRRSARESKGHRSSRLRVMARDLTQRCAAIESTQGTDAASRQDEDGARVAAKRRRTVEQRAVSREESAHASGSQEEQEDIEEVSYEAPPQDEEQDGPSTSYGGSSASTRKHILIIGHSYVYWAERYAAASHWGSNLGLGARATITWKGLRGMQWGQLGRATAFGHCPPDLLLIHLGGNDLPRLPGKALILDILRDLKRLKTTYPTMRIIWSTIIPRIAWRGSVRTAAVNRARRGVNREVCRGVCNGIGSVIGHHNIQAGGLQMFRSDGVHLSDEGLEVFLEDVRGGLLAELTGLCGGHGT
uniref:SGNH hydrolase-type esterase domain-containing protein n=1 Tax=Pogona vitticeps TaxID=103695 RepID=A0ABM5FH18_9SAUR